MVSLVPALLVLHGRDEFGMSFLIRVGASTISLAEKSLVVF